MRNAKHSDLLELVQMGREFAEAAKVPFDRDKFAETVEGLIDSDEGVILISPAGMIAGVVYDSFFHPDFRVAQELFWWVRPEHRGNRLGIALLGGFEEWAVQKDAKRVIMVALQELTPRKVGKLYIGRGYTPLEHSYSKEL
jgi:GNAT superfamily N-acetyltransferase